MKIYKVELDVNNYQQFVVESDEPEIYKKKLKFIDCKPKSGNWNPPTIRVFNPMLEKGDFYRLAVGTFAMNIKAMDLLRTECELAGEVLPIKCGKEQFYAINILECVNCLDHLNCKFDIDEEFTDENGNPVIDDIEVYAFLEGMLPEASIFKIPEDICGIYTYTGHKNPEDEFKNIVDSNNLKGLKFKLIYSTS